MAKEITLEKLATMIAGGFDETNGRIDKLEKKVDKGFTEIDKRFNKVDQRFDRVEKRLAIIEFEMTESVHRDELRQYVSRLERVEAKLGLK